MIKKSISLESQIRDDWHYLKKIKSKDITKYMCDVAFSIDYEAIKYIPNRYKEEYSAYVMKQNWLLYNYCDVQSLTIDDWKDVLSKINLNYIDLNRYKYLVRNFNKGILSGEIKYEEKQNTY